MNFIDKIDTYLLSRESKKRDVHYVSDVSDCVRKLYYKWTDHPVSNPIEAGALLKMRMGDSVHDLVHEVLSASGCDVIPEMSVRKNYPGLKYPVSMRCDNLFSEKGSQEIEVIEVKSSYGAGIVRIQKSGMPKKEHLAQVCFYGDGFEARKGYLLYIGRDNAYRCQFDTVYEDGAIFLRGRNKPIIQLYELIGKLSFIEDSLEAEVLPNREYWAAIKNGEIRDLFQKDNVKYKSDWQCLYCQYRSACWENEIEEYQSGDNSATMPNKEEE